MSQERRKRSNGDLIDFVRISGHLKHEPHQMPRTQRFRAVNNKVQDGSVSVVIEAFGKPG